MTSNPIIDLAEALPIFLSIEIIITGLFSLSFVLDATIPITPSCKLFPLIIMAICGINLCSLENLI